MGIEIPDKYGGSECNFMTTILAVEEIAKVDGAVAALVDIHNTLVNSLIAKIGTEEQKAKYLPKLAQVYVSGDFLLFPSMNCLLSTTCFSAGLLLPYGACFWIRCLLFKDECHQGWLRLRDKRNKNVDFKLRYRRIIFGLCECRSVCCEFQANTHYRFLRALLAFSGVQFTEHM